MRKARWSPFARIARSTRSRSLSESARRGAASFATSRLRGGFRTGAAAIAPSFSPYFSRWRRVTVACRRLAQERPSSCSWRIATCHASSVTSPGSLEAPRM
jgi:hypothetical protein